MIINIDADDTYSVYIVKIHGYKTIVKTNKLSTLYFEEHDIYCDQIKSVVENAYDNLIRKECQGFIPM